MDKEKLLEAYDEYLKLGATKEQLAALSAFIWCGKQQNKKKKFPDFYDVLGILSDNPRSQEEIEKMRRWSKVQTNRNLR